MKELIRSNEAILGNTFVVDAELTTRPFPPTLGVEGDIFMAELGNEIPGKPGPGPKKPFEDVGPQKESGSQQAALPGSQAAPLEGQERLNAVKEMLIRKLWGEEPKDKKEKKRRVSPEEARKAWMEHYKGRELKGEELNTVNWLINLGYTPDLQRSPFEQAQDFLLGPEMKAQFQRQIGELGEQAPELGIVAQKRKQAGEEGMPEKNRAHLQIDTTGITNAAYLQQLDQINHYGDVVGHGNYDLDFIARKIGDILAIDVPVDQQGQLELVKQRITDLIQEQRRLDNEIRNAQGRYFNPEQTRAIDENSDRRSEIFEEIFRGVDSSPGVRFNEAFSLEARSKWDEFITRVSRIGDENLTREFSARAKIREILHDANWSVSGGGNIQAFAEAASTYKDEYTDLIFSDPLVESALHFFEQGFQQIKAENNGQLPYEKLEWNFKRRVLNPDGTYEEKPGSDLEDLVLEAMKKAIQAGAIKDVVRDDSRKIVFGPDKKPKIGSISKDVLNPGNEWRLQSAIVLARGFGVLSLRFPEIAAEARLPEATALTGADVSAQRTASIYGESVSQWLDINEHLIEKFGVGQENRAILYYFLTGDRKKLQNKNDLRRSLDEKRTQFTPGDDERLIDQINYFRTGGPFSHSSWRARVSFEMLPNESEVDFKNRVKRSGIGVLEARVEGDVDDEIKHEVREELRNSRDFVDKTDKDIELSEELSRKFQRAVEAKEKQFIPGEVNHLNERMKHKDYLLLQKRLDMWKNALRTNPLRVMWEWENKERQKKNPGQRVRFLAEALGVNQDEAKGLIGSVERDLMIVQEDFVSLRKPIDENNEDLDFEVIGRDTEDETITGNDRIMERRENVRKYVEKIREKAAEGDFRFFKDVLLKYASVTGDPGIDTPFPFVVGFDDIPFGEFDFIKSGGRGMSRKINDFASAYGASVELINLISGLGTAQSIEPLVQHLVKIKESLSKVDSELAQKLIPPFAEGTIRMYKKDFAAKMPLGIGTLWGMIGDSSFMQKYKGMTAMSLDETDLYNFSRHLVQNSLISMKELEKFRWKVGATFFHALLDFSRTYGQLMLLVMAIEFANRTAKGK